MEPSAEETTSTQAETADFAELLAKAKGIFGSRGEKINSIDAAIGAIPRIMELAEHLPGTSAKDAVLNVIRFYSREQGAGSPWATVRLVAETLIDKIMDGQSGKLALNISGASASGSSVSAATPDPKARAILVAYAQIKASLKDGLSAAEIAALVPRVMEAIEESRAIKGGEAKTAAALEILEQLADDAGISDKPAWRVALATARGSMKVYALASKGHFSLNKGSLKDLTDVAAVVLEELGGIPAVEKCCPCL